MSLRVLVTGGRGFLGGFVARALAAGGYDVATPARSELDVAEASHWDRLGVGFDAVVHAAAFVPAGATSADDVPLAIRIGSLGTHHAIEWAIRHGVRRFVYCSSADVYARGGEVPIDEDGRVDPGGNAAVYGLGKLWGEMLARAARAEGRLETVSLRFSQIHGAGMRPRGVVAAFAARARDGEALRVDAPEATGDFLYAKDAAAATLAALRADAPAAVYNVGSGTETSLADLAAHTWHAFRPDAPRITLGDAAGVRFALDVRRAARDLGFTPAFDVAAGLADWAREESR